MKFSTKKKFIRFNFRYLLWFVKMWYGLTMRLTKVKNVKIAEYNSYQEIVTAIDYGNKWRSDPLGGAFDTLNHPSYFQDRLNRDKAKVEDCDGHAAYWCASLLSNGLASKAWFSFFQMRKRDTGKVSGHAVCVFEDYQGRMKWCDYTLPELIDPSKDDWHWANQAGNSFNADVVAAGMIAVKRVKDDGSIVFGKITKKIDF